MWNDTTTKVKENGDPEDLVDAILCPAGPGPAASIDCTRYWGYLSQWNLLDYPAVVFPVTKLNASVDTTDEAYEPINKEDQWNHELCKSFCGRSLCER